MLAVKKMTIGKKIKQIRESLGYSQKQFAELIGVSQMALSKWERGERNPSKANIHKLCELTNEPFTYFIEEQEENHGIVVDIHFFAYYSHRYNEIQYSTKTKTLDKEEYGLQNIPDEVIKERYFIYELRKDYPPYKAGGLILFEKLDRAEDIKPEDFLILFSTGDIWRHDKGEFFSFVEEEAILDENMFPIAVARQFISVQV